MQNPRVPTDPSAQPKLATVADRELLASLLGGRRLPTVVPLALDALERDPLVTVGCFPGDLLRGLMTVPGSFWRRFPTLYERYRAAIREGAARRRRLPYAERMRFWDALALDGGDEPPES